MVFCYVGTKTFTYSHKNLDFWPKNGQNWSKICVFGQFGPNIAILSNARFSVMWVTKLLISPGKIRIYCNSLGIFVSLFLQVNALCDPSTGAIIQKIVQDKYRSLPCSIMWTSCFCQTESSSFCWVGIVRMEIWTADFVNNIDKFLCS